MTVLDGLMKSSPVQEQFKQGEIIFGEKSDSNNKMHVIIAGRADIFKNYGLPSEMRIATIQEGDFVGEMSLFLNNSRSATVVAATDVAVVAIDKAGMMKFLENPPEVLFNFIRTLCLRLDNSNQIAATNRIRYEQGLAAMNNEKLQLVSAFVNDPLTGTHNMASFLEQSKTIADKAHEKNRHVFLALFEVDYLSEIDEVYGNEMGDQVLRSFAQTVTSVLMPGDLFARYNGTQFILLMTSHSKDDGITIIEQLCNVIAEAPIQWEGHSVSISTSIGLAQALAGYSIDMAINLAKSALSEAIEAGRNQVAVFGIK